MIREEKESKIKEHLETALEREMRQIERKEKRTRRAGEKEKERQKWIDAAERVDKSKLDEMWNDEPSEDSSGQAIGLFSGITFKNGKIVK
jgi:hypothetical protein